jgi:hypothetical protein
MSLAHLRASAFDGDTPGVSKNSQVEVYITEYQSVADAVSNSRAYFTCYNQERLHQALAYQTPATVYGGQGGKQ